MSSKTGRGYRLEADIEKSREESNWKKVIELAEHLKSRNQAGLGEFDDKVGSELGLSL